eukprot:14377253-Heterocapsa_arctica.AAC.1
MEVQNGLVREKCPPQSETGKAAVPQGKTGGNHFVFRRRVRNTSLANRSNRKAIMRATDREVIPG